MRWVLLWLVLVLLAAAFLSLIIRRVWRQMKAMNRDIASASQRMSEVSPGNNGQSAP